MCHELEPICILKAGRRLSHCARPILKQHLFHNKTKQSFLVPQCVHTTSSLRLVCSFVLCRDFSISVHAPFTNHLHNLSALSVYPTYECHPICVPNLSVPIYVYLWMPNKGAFRCLLQFKLDLYLSCEELTLTQDQPLYLGIVSIIAMSETGE